MQSNFNSVYDASTCKLIKKQTQDYFPPWPREYATFNTTSSHDLSNSCFSPAERKKQQHAYKLTVLNNNKNYHNNLSKKQQYSNLVNKASHTSRINTFAIQTSTNTSPNIQKLPQIGNTLILPMNLSRNPIIDSKQIFGRTNV